MDAWNQDIKDKWEALGKLAQGITPTLLPTFCDAADFDAVRTDLETLARHVDRLIFAYGEAIKSRSTHKVELHDFRDPLRDALDGFALYEIDKCCEAANKQHAA